MQEKVQKIIAVLLIIVMLYAVAGTVVSYAADAILSATELETQGTATNNANVEFNTYYEDGKHSKNIDISSTDTKLITEVKVNNVGYLKNITIDFSGANFKISSAEPQSAIQLLDTENKKIVLNQINQGEDVKINLTIAPDVKDSVTADFCNRQNTVAFSGTYVNDKSAEVSVSKNIKIETNYIKDSSTIKVNATQEVTKYIPYSLNGKTGVLLQTTVKTGIQDSVLPVKDTTVEFTVPKINSTLPDKVMVIAESTKSTNGNTAETQIAVNDTIYDKTTGILTLKTENKADANGNIAWAKNAQDEYRIISIYSADVYTAVNGKSTNISLATNVKNNLYSKNNVQLSVNQTATNSYSAVIGNFVDVNSAIIEDSINKGYMYNNKIAADADKLETSYNEKYQAYVANADLVDSIKITQEYDKFATTTNETASTVAGTNYAYDKTVTINKAEMQKILGAEGTITLLSGTTTLSTINKDTTADANGNIVTDVSSFNTNNISVLTSKPATEGTLEVNVAKEIAKTNAYTEAQIKSFVNLKTNTTAEVKNGTTALTATIAEDTAALTEPTAKSSVSINKEALSTVINNTGVEIRAVLETNSIDDKLYNNPNLEIKLPEYIENITLDSSNLLYGNELTLSSANLKDNADGTKSILVNIAGKQTKYNDNTSNGPTVVLTLSIKPRVTTPSKDETITLSGSDANGAEIAGTCTFKYAAPDGLVTINSIGNYAGDGKETTAINGTDKTVTVAPFTAKQTVTVNGEIINNKKNTISNTKILINMPTQGKNSNTFTMNMLSGITLKNGDAKIYYTDNADATSDLTVTTNKWTETVTDYSTIRAALIVLNNKLDVGGTVSYSYNLELPANLEYNNKDYIKYKAEYIDNSAVGDAPATEASSNIILTTGQGPKLDMTITNNANNGAVKQGQLVNINVAVTNSGEVTATNAKATITVPTGAQLVTYAEGNAIYTTDGTNAAINIGTIEKGQTKSANYIVKIDTNADTAKKLDFTVNAVADNNLKANSTVSLNVEKGYLTVVNRQFVGENTTTLKEGQRQDFIIQIINNSSEKVTNLSMEYQLPTGFTINSVGIVKVDQDIVNGVASGFTTDNNKIVYKGATIEANKILEIKINATVSATTEFETMAVVNGKANNADIGATNSNIWKYGVTLAAVEVKALSQDNQEVKEGKEVAYEFQIANVGTIDLSQNKIYAVLSDGMTFEKAEIKFSNEDKTYTIKDMTKDGLLKQILTVQKGTSINVKVYAITKTLTDEEIKNNIDKQLTTTLKYQFNGNIEKSAKATYYLVYDKDAHNQASGNEGGNTNPSTPDTTYKITGKVWFDENKDGQREDTEKGMSGIKVLLLNASDSTIAVDKDSKAEKIVTTDENGDYAFTNLAQGQYRVAFLYDYSKYSVADYQKAGVAESANSDAIEMDAKYENKDIKAGLTNNITITEASARSMDLGLTTASTFDLELQKTINKITVKTPEGTQVYDYSSDAKSVSKVEIPDKYLNSSTIVAEYKITVKNTGNVAGYAKKIVDYLPKDMKFSSELNTAWYLGTDGNAYNQELSDIEIQPGESKEIKIVLTKTMTSNSTGLVNNNAEIFESYNKDGLTDKNSTPGNKNTSEKDLSNANLILSVKTGQPVVYVTLTIAVIAIMGFGVFEIKKHLIDKK